MRKRNLLIMNVSLYGFELINMRGILLIMIPFLALSCNLDSLNKERHLDGIEILLQKVDRDSIEPKKLTNLSVTNGFRGLHLGLNYDSLAYDTNLWFTNVDFLDDSIIGISGKKEILFGGGKEDIDLSLTFYNKTLVGISLRFRSVFYESLVKTYGFPNIHNDYRTADDTAKTEIIRIGRSDGKGGGDYAYEPSKPLKEETEEEKLAIWEYNGIKMTYRNIIYEYPNEGMNKVPANEKFRASLPNTSLFIESVREMDKVRAILKRRAIEKEKKELIEERKEKVGDF